MNGNVVRRISEQEVTPVPKIDLATRRMPGMSAWLLHRITGLGITFYLLCHVALIGTLIFLGGPHFDTSLVTLMHNPVFVGLDFLLLAAVLIHALNGIRILLVDLGALILHQKALFYGAMVVAAVLFGLGIYRVLS